MAASGFVKGVHEVAEGVFAYLQPDGGWGWSNAGLVVDDNRSLLVDTLFDLRLTAEMLEAMRRVTPAAASIGTVVNTHANGDHCYGNALVSQAEIIASERCAQEMGDVPPATMDAMLRAVPDMGATGAFISRIFGAFDFSGIELTPPTRTFSGRLDLKVGGKRVSLIEVGPAHTGGDVVVHLPDDGVVFTGDILFHGGHPIVWAGPVSNWIGACQAVLALDAPIVVPGHGPIAGRQAVTDLKGYFEWLTGEARSRFDAGMAPLDAARDIGIGPYGDWGESERVVVNICALYREFGDRVDRSALDLMALMAEMSPG